MVSSIGDQNKALSQAAKAPKDTSPRLKASTNYSAAVASTKNKLGSEPIDNLQPQKTVRTGNKIKGSLEGLFNAPSTVIQFKNSGYDSRSNQKARFADKNIDIKNQLSNSLSSFGNKNYSIMNNYSSMTVEKSSSDRLSKIIRNNNF